MRKHHHEDRELSVFTRFLAARGISAAQEHSSERPEPEPDILFAFPGQESIAYELVELLDQGWGRHMSDMGAIYAALKETHAKLSLGTKSVFDAKYRNADIGFAFTNQSTNRQRVAAMPSIFAAMLDLPDGVEGPALEDASGFAAVLEHVFIGRVDSLVGPIFHPSGGLWVSEPTVPTLQAKFAKAETYRTAAPIELLAYIDRNAQFPEDVWQANLADFLNGVAAIPFRRIWVLDLKSDKLHCPYSKD